MNYPKITVGFITYENSTSLDACVYSAIKEIPEVEVVVVGGKNKFNNPKIKHISFDESIKPKWITKKKNIITENACGDVIVYCHDYYYFLSGWLDAWNKYGWDWDYACNRIELIDGQRDYDLMSWDHPTIPRYYMIPYENCNDPEIMKYTYVSGGFFLAKKEFMKKNPLNENLLWGMREDVEWSLRARTSGKYNFNVNAAVKHNKPHIRFINSLKK